METQTFRIDGMSCDACVKHVTRGLQELKGVQTAQVSLSDKKAVVVFDPGQVKIDEMIAAVDEEGYAASPLAG